MEIRIYDEKTGRFGVKASLYDICEWWIETYPPDIFVNSPKPIVEARMCMQNILALKKRFD